MSIALKIPEETLSKELKEKLEKRNIEREKELLMKYKNGEITFEKLKELL